MASGEQDKHLQSIAPVPGGPLQRKPPVLRKAKKSSTACLPCKQAKRKCSGRPEPCTACQNTGADCVFDETLDLRRKVAAKRTLGEMEYYRGLFYALIESLRTSNDEKLHQILESIRRGSDMSDIPTAVEAPPVDFSDLSSECPRSIGSAEDAFSQHERLVVDPLARITVEKLCDYPLFQVQSSPWTNVTDDNHLVSHLISLYFIWDHPLLQVIDRELFLKDMSNKDTSSEFCTPVLVNSILAVASTYSDFPEAFAIPGDAASRGQHFFMKAESLWKAEDGQATLTNIQALVLMSHHLKFQGKERVSWLMFRQAVQLAQDFGMFRAPRSKYHQWDKMSESIKRASTTTAWGIFILNSQISMESGITPNLEFPRSVLDPRDSRDNNAMWTPYPRSNYVEYPMKPALLRYVMTEMVDLTEVILEIQELLFDKAFDIGIKEVWSEASKLYKRLDNFLKRLQDVQSIEDQPVPQILFLFIRCHQVVISLFGSFLEHQDFDPSSYPSEVKQARLTQLYSAKQIARYLRLHRVHYGLRQIPGLMLGPTNSSILTLLMALDDDEALDALAELCRFLMSFSKRLPAANDVIRNIDSIVRDSKIVLPSGVATVLNYRGAQTWV